MVVCPPYICQLRKTNFMKKFLVQGGRYSTSQIKLTWVSNSLKVYAQYNYKLNQLLVLNGHDRTKPITNAFKRYDLKSIKSEASHCYFEVSHI